MNLKRRSMIDDEFFAQVCQWDKGNCRKSIAWGDKKYACCSREICPNICPLGKTFPNRCKNPPPICKYFLCNIAKIYIMEHPELHKHYTKLLLEADKLGLEYNATQ